MKSCSPFLFLSILLTSCSLLDDGGNDDLPCDSIETIDLRIRDAIAYEDGQVLAFDASDGTSFTATVTEVLRLDPTQNSGCQEEISYNFDGINVNNSLQTGIRLVGGSEELRFNHFFSMNGFANQSLNVDLNANGEITGSPAPSRLIPDTVLNGQTFNNVLVIDYGDAPVRRSFYNLTSGFIGVEAADGMTIFLRE